MARRILVCGSAAAEGIPGIHCVCDTCVEARRRGGKDLRTRTAYDLGDDLRVDYGPDSYWHARNAGRDFSTLRHLFVTHSHSDHWYPKDLDFRRPGFCVLPDGPPLRIWGSEFVLEAAHESMRDDAARVEFRLTRSLREYEVEPDIRLITLRAAHGGYEDAMNFIIEERTGRSVLVANDTGWWDDETWGFVAGRRVDVAFIDCTYGCRDQREGHMGAPAAIEFAERLRGLGCLHDQSRVIVNHFSHNGNALHADLEAFCSPAGIEVGYDGMVIE